MQGSFDVAIDIESNSLHIPLPSANTVFETSETIGNPNIEFRLAKLDPNGNCTSGINRIFSNMTKQANDCIKDLIMRLKLKNFILGGSSYGGGIALNTYLRHPEIRDQIKGIVIIAAAGHSQSIPPYVRRMGGWLGKIKEKRLTGEAGAVIPSLCTGEAGAQP